MSELANPDSYREAGGDTQPGGGVEIRIILETINTDYAIPSHSYYLPKI